MRGNGFLSVADFSSDEVRQVVEQARRIKGENPSHLLDGKTIALLFEKPSLRTRVSFEVGIRQMGGHPIYLSREDIGLGVREPVKDIARVLGRWVDALVARVFDHEDLETLAGYSDVPVINALSDLEHPCQAIADILTILEHKDRLEGLKVAFVGDGNNVAASLAVACASVAADFTLASPEDYRVAAAPWEEATRRAISSESRVEWVAAPEEAVRGADVVYTDVWASMGQESEREERRRAFAAYQVDTELMSGAKPGAIFLHDMPAHEGEEIAPGMLEHPGSVVFDQAENRLHAQKAILTKLLAPG